jgi:hypothetical protein
MKTTGTLLGVLFLVMMTTSAAAVPTEITVHVKTKDAKFLGTSMGGALVTIKDAQTGEMLAKGVTSGFRHPMGGTGQAHHRRRCLGDRGTGVRSGCSRTAGACELVRHTAIGRHPSQCHHDVRLPFDARWRVGRK